MTQVIASTDRHVCLVTSGHLASNPRIVKEADALYDAGYRVTVVAADITPAVRALDEQMLPRLRWRCVRIDRGRWPLWAWRRCRSLVALALRRLGARQPALAVAAHSAFSSRLRAALRTIPAHLYIAHNLAALPAAHRAAQQHRARLGFDAEDYHPGELPEQAAHHSEIETRKIMLRGLLPACHHLTAASPLIGAAYLRGFGTPMRTVLNVFPRPDPGAAPASQNESSDGLRFYWFSQTVSLDRGLQEFIAVLGELDGRPSLHIQGHATDAVRAALSHTAAAHGVPGRIHFLPTVAPDALLASARRYDVGLSLERDQPRNRALCLTNKIFLYLQAGLPQVLSDTPAQRAIAADLAGAAVLIDPANPRDSARRIQASLGHRRQRVAAQQHAGRLARDHFCWEIERHKFLDSVADCFATGSCDRQAHSRTPGAGHDAPRQGAQPAHKQAHG